MIFAVTEKGKNDMAECKECLHYEICEIMEDQYGISKVYPSQCGYFRIAADVVLKSEYERLKDLNNQLECDIVNANMNSDHAAVVIREIFEDVRNALAAMGIVFNCQPILCEIEKKYTEEEK